MIQYLTEKELVAINYAVIKQISPDEDFGIKDSAALKTVITQPQQNIFDEELYPTIYQKAAILTEMIVNKHCFYNGNKRTAVMEMYMFLRKNGIRLTVSNQAIADYVVLVAVQKGKECLKIEEIAKWIVENSEAI